MKHRRSFLFMLLSLAFLLRGQSWASAADGASVYAKAGDDGIIVASSDVWYFEEFDGFGRPVSGTLWKGGSIAELTSWVYYGETQQARAKITTGKAGSLETGYDRSGNVIELTRTDSSGAILESEKNTYDEKNRPLVQENVKGKDFRRTEYEYGKDSRRTETSFVNGKPQYQRNWIDDDNWTERIYNDGVVVLTVDYVDGARKDWRNENQK
jgi:hypothetical protein